MRVNKNNLSFEVVKSCNHPEVWWKNNYPGWEEHTFHFFDRLLKEDMTYFDIGTYCGLTILYACQKVRHAYGIDIDPSAFDACHSNIQVNNFKNVTLELAGLSGKDAARHIVDSLQGTSGCRLGAPGTYQNNTKVECFTIESLINRWNVEKCDFIKMDIEGAEEECLPMMGSFFETYDPIFYLSVHKHLGATAKTIVESTQHYKYVYDKSYNNVYDNLYEEIESRAHSHGEQDYLFSSKPLDNLL